MRPVFYSQKLTVKNWPHSHILKSNNLIHMVQIFSYNVNQVKLKFEHEKRDACDCIPVRLKRDSFNEVDKI